jgi:hypothetical protein
MTSQKRLNSILGTAEIVAEVYADSLSDISKPNHNEEGLSSLSSGKCRGNAISNSQSEESKEYDSVDHIPDTTDSTWKEVDYASTNEPFTG